MKDRYDIRRILKSETTLKYLFLIIVVSGTILKELFDIFEYIIFIISVGI